MRTRALARFLFLLPLLAAGAAFAEDPPALVELSLVPETDGMEPKARVALYAFVTNKSSAELSALSLNALPGRFEVVGETRLASSLAPFESTNTRFRLQLRPGEEVHFGKYQVPLVLRYHWKAPPPKHQAGTPAVLEGNSAQQAAVTVEVQAPYSAVASGLPGGTGPLFWLLLPVIPAFLAFQLVQGLRKRQGPQIPTFSADNVLPAFFIAILVNTLPFWSSTLAELSTGWLLAGSAMLGALWPLCLWIRDEVRWRRWGFRDQDEALSYFRKALLSRWVSRPPVWATGKMGDAQWEGLILGQPGGGLVLGSQLQVSPVNQDPTERKRIENLVSKANLGKRRDRRQLVRELDAKNITLTPSLVPKLGTAQSKSLAVTGAVLQGFTMESVAREPLLVYRQ